MKVLIVDSDPVYREFLEETFSLLSHNATSVSDGYDAIDYVMEHTVDLAYIEINIPGIDGFQTFNKIREVDPNVLSIMMYRTISKAMMNNIIQDGIIFCISKPFSISVIEEIDKILIDHPLSQKITNRQYNQNGLDSESVLEAKILIVDDTDEIVDVIRRCLEYEGFHNLSSTHDGQEAIDDFNAKKHDVVITDIVMPRKNGMDVLKHVKAVSVNSQVIIITANGNKDTAITAVKCGAYDYIEKPFNLGTLSRIVKLAVEKRIFLDNQIVH